MTQMTADSLDFFLICGHLRHLRIEIFLLSFCCYGEIRVSNFFRSSFLKRSMNEKIRMFAPSLIVDEQKCSLSG